MAYNSSQQFAPKEEELNLESEKPYTKDNAEDKLYLLYVLERCTYMKINVEYGEREKICKFATLYSVTKLRAFKN